MALPATGGPAALSWVALKVGALLLRRWLRDRPVMQHDAVHTYHWMTRGQFLNAVALGQITPGRSSRRSPSSATRRRASSVALLAAFVAFAPSFVFILGGGPPFDRLRTNHWAQGFLTGAGAASVGAIAGATVPLALSLEHLWQLGVLAVAAVWVFALRRGVVSALVGAGLLGVIAAFAGFHLPA